MERDAGLAHQETRVPAASQQLALPLEAPHACPSACTWDSVAEGPLLLCCAVYSDTITLVPSFSHPRRPSLDQEKDAPIMFP